MKDAIRFSFLKPARVSAADLADLNRLLPQVSRKFRPTRRAEVMRTLHHGFVLAARDATRPRGRIIGMATLVPAYTVSRRQGTIHDVVVDAAYRGQGIGTQLMQKLIAHAKKIGLARINLTSGSDRKAGNKLYQRLGFAIYKTNHYRMEL